MKNNKSKKRYITLITEKNNKSIKSTGYSYIQLNKQLKFLHNEYSKLLINNNQNTDEGKLILTALMMLHDELKKIDKTISIKPSFPPDRIVK